MTRGQSTAGQGDTTAAKTNKAVKTTKAAGTRRSTQSVVAAATATPGKQSGETGKRPTARLGTPPNTAEKRTMSEAHRVALQAGREETRIVRAYLDALEQHRPRRGPRKDPEKLQQRLDVVKKQIVAAQPLERLALHQEQLDLERELETSVRRGGLSELEKSFVEIAASYSERHGLSVQAWLAVGVGKATLRRAGIVG